MDERDFELLKTLGETGNITRTAEILFTTQSSLSKSSKSIELDLGEKILIRSRQGIRFTPAGEAVLKQSIVASAAMQSMRQDLLSLHGEVSGTLNAGISINYAQYLLPDKLAKYHQKYPNVKLNIQTGQSRHLYRQMVEGKLDAAILRGHYNWDNGKYLLSQEKLCAVYNRSFSDTDLKDIMYIDHKTDISLEASVNKWMQENDLAGCLSSGFCVDSIGTCLALVKRGLGWAILPEIASKNYDGIIRPLYFENGEPFLRSTYILFQKEAIALPQVNTFVNLIRDNKKDS